MADMITKGVATGEPCYARPNWVEVDTDAIRHNLGKLRGFVGPGVRIFAALKGNACGFGLVPAARLVSASGADGLAVVDLGDGVAVRQSGVTVPVLLYAGNRMVRETVETAIRFDLMLTVHSQTSARCLTQNATAPIRVFVEVNSGGERLGLDPDEVLATIAALRHSPHIEIAGVYTHMHVPAGQAAEPHLEWEFHRFEDILRALDAAGMDIPIRMAASSKTLLVTEKMNLSAIDPGHLLFGLDPGGYRKLDLGLRCAFHALKSRLVQVRRLRRPEGQHEHAPFPICEGMRIGVLPMGWSDGLGTLHCGEVLVRGRRAPILGKPSAEHVKVDLTGIPEAVDGDEVVFIGPQGEAAIPLAEVRRHQGGINESAVTRGISRAIPRVYI